MQGMVRTALRCCAGDAAIMWDVIAVGRRVVVWWFCREVPGNLFGRAVARTGRMATTRDAATHEASGVVVVCRGRAVWRGAARPPPAGA